MTTRYYAATAHQQWATEALGEDCMTWIIRQKAEGMTWRTIASMLADKGGPRLRPETLRRWEHHLRKGN